MAWKGTVVQRFGWNRILPTTTKKREKKKTTRVSYIDPELVRRSVDTGPNMTRGSKKTDLMQQQQKCMSNGPNDGRYSHL